MRMPHSSAYRATFVIDGQTWPFSGTAVSLNRQVRAEHKTLLGGERLRVVSLPYSGLKRAIRQPDLRVSFENISHEWLKRLENLMEGNKSFDVELLAFDAQEDSTSFNYLTGQKEALARGVPLLPTKSFNTAIKSPRRITCEINLSTDDLNIGPTQAGVSNIIPGAYHEYYISAIKNNTETKPAGPVIADFDGSDPEAKLAAWLYFSHIPEAEGYHIYGNTPAGVFKLLKIINAGDLTNNQKTGVDPIWKDNGTIVPVVTPPIIYDEYISSAERRWLDDPRTFSLAIASGFGSQERVVINNASFYDHNGVFYPNAPQVEVDTRVGKVVFQESSAPLAFQEVWAKYIWCPEVLIEDIDPNPRPVQGSDTPASGGPLDRRYGVSYSPMITLFVKK
jgi:hypothetical protein